MTQDITISTIQDSILTLPERPPFMLAVQLAEFYETKTENVAKAYRRNIERFPNDFVFELNELETATLRGQNGGAKLEKARYAPVAFTQIGAFALSGCLKTPRAAEVSVLIHRAFVQMMDRSDEMAALQHQNMCLKEQVLIGNPLWNKIERAQNAGWPRYSARYFIKRSADETDANIAYMEELGLIRSEDWKQLHV